MDIETFGRRVQIHRLRSETIIAAARMVLVEGRSQMDACRTIGTTSGQISPVVRKLSADTCPCCGQKI
jgi:hypothetical protein